MMDRRTLHAFGVSEAGHLLVGVHEDAGGVVLQIGSDGTGAAVVLSGEAAEHVARLLSEAAVNDRLMSRVLASEPF